MSVQPTQLVESVWTLTSHFTSELLVEGAYQRGKYEVMLPVQYCQELLALLVHPWNTMATKFATKWWSLASLLLSSVCPRVTLRMMLHPNVLHQQCVLFSTLRSVLSYVEEPGLLATTEELLINAQADAKLPATSI